MMRKTCPFLVERTSYEVENDEIEGIELPRNDDIEANIEQIRNDVQNLSTLENSNETFENQKSEEHLASQADSNER